MFQIFGLSNYFVQPELYITIAWLNSKTVKLKTCALFVRATPDSFSNSMRPHSYCLKAIAYKTTQSIPEYELMYFKKPPNYKTCMKVILLFILNVVTTSQYPLNMCGFFPAYCKDSFHLSTNWGFFHNSCMFDNSILEIIFSTYRASTIAISLHKVMNREHALLRGKENGKEATKEENDCCSIEVVVEYYLSQFLC